MFAKLIAKLTATAADPRERLIILRQKHSDLQVRLQECRLEQQAVLTTHAEDIAMAAIDGTTLSAAIRRAIDAAQERVRGLELALTGIERAITQEMQAHRETAAAEINRRLEAYQRACASVNMATNTLLRAAFALRDNAHPARVQLGAELAAIHADILKHGLNSLGIGSMGDSHLWSWGGLEPDPAIVDRLMADAVAGSSWQGEVSDRMSLLLEVLDQPEKPHKWRAPHRIDLTRFDVATIRAGLAAKDPLAILRGFRIAADDAWRDAATFAGAELIHVLMRQLRETRELPGDVQALTSMAHAWFRLPEVERHDVRAVTERSLDPGAAAAAPPPATSTGPAHPAPHLTDLDTMRPLRGL